MNPTTTKNEEPCPRCGHAMPAIAGYVTWCEACEWNLDPDRVPGAKPGLLDRWNRRLGAKASEALLDEVLADSSRPAGWRLSKLAAYTFAAALLAADLYFFYEGIRTLLNIVVLSDFFAGLLFVGLGLLLRPRFQWGWKKGVAREQYPALYGLLDDMAAEMNAPQIDGIMMQSYPYNAFFTRTNGIGRRWIGIGMPLFSALSMPEKIHVLAHEMAHNANRDVTRNWLVNNAMNTLSSIYGIVMPHYDYTEVFGPFHYVQLYLRKFVGLLIFGLWYLLGMVTWRESQRAEYYADRMAAQISGTRAGLSAMEKLHYYPTFYITLERVAEYRYSNDLFGEFRYMAGHVPDKEIRRIQRIMESATTRFDSSHPPTALRKKQLAYHQVHEPALYLNKETMERLEKEFAELERKAQHILLDHFRSWAS